MGPSPEPSSPSLCDEDVGAIVRLIAEVGGMDLELSEKRRHLIFELSVLINADSYIWTKLGKAIPGEAPTFAIYLKHGFTESQFATYMRLLEHPDMRGFNAPLMEAFSDRQPHVTRRYQQLDPDGRFLDSGAAPMWNAAGLGGFLASARTTSAGEISAVFLYRRPGRALFSEREAKIAHILLSEVPWLHDTSWTHHPRKPIHELSPRLNTVLNLMLQGHGRKWIADECQISPHTLNDYVKDLFRRFDVHSQSELISRLFQGDGGDAP